MKRRRKGGEKEREEKKVICYKSSSYECESGNECVTLPMSMT